MSEDFKDNTEQYFQYRPKYPPELFHWLASISPTNEHVWDCATGSGQAAIELVKLFDKVTASDINKSQLLYAPVHPKIKYECFSSEEAILDDNTIDLITVGCAIHWFNRDKFYKEVRRVCNPESILAVWTYVWPWTGIKPLDKVLTIIKEEELAGYWPKAAELYINRYKGLDFPFEEISPPNFSIKCHWNSNDILNFIETWSASQRFFKKNHYGVCRDYRKEFEMLWARYFEKEVFELPLYFRVGKVGLL